MARKGKEDPARSRPLTLEFLREMKAMEGFAAPGGAFDPAGAWTAWWRLWLVNQAAGAGSLCLRRQPRESGGIRLGVELAVAEMGGYVRRTDATLDCAADALCTPRSWTLSSRSVGLDGQAIEGTEMSQAGTIADGRLEVRFGRRSRKEELPAAATSNWSLFEAVQRLAGQKAGPLKFALLGEMDLLKPEQRLTFREARDFEVNGARLRLRGYQQIGRGVLPWQYWVDGQGRLLFAFSGVRAWIHDPQAEKLMQEKLQAARARQVRLKGGRQSP